MIIYDAYVFSVDGQRVDSWSPVVNCPFVFQDDETEEGPSLTLREMTDLGWFAAADD